jgi:hypothetical protein
MHIIVASSHASTTHVNGGGGHRIGTPATQPRMSEPAPGMQTSVPLQKRPSLHTASCGAC